MTTRTTKTERTEAAERLREWLRPGSTVYCILRHRSASGMSRVIQLVTIDPADCRHLFIGYNAAAAMDERYDRDREGIRVSGAGMDMGFHLVYNLGATLWPDGFTCSGDACPSNAHTNGSPRPHDYPTEYAGHPVTGGQCPVYRCGLPASEHPTKPEHHNDGGYALRHEWL